MVATQTERPGPVTISQAVCDGSDTVVGVGFRFVSELDESGKRTMYAAVPHGHVCAAIIRELREVGLHECRAIRHEGKDGVVSTSGKRSLLGHCHVRYWFAGEPRLSRNDAW